MSKQEEADVEVRKIDQENINKFGRLNARLHELRAEKDSHKVRTLNIKNQPHTF